MGIHCIDSINVPKRVEDIDMEKKELTEEETNLVSEVGMKVGFMNMQKTKCKPEPNILLDSGSTILLFRDNEFLEKTWGILY